MPAGLPHVYSVRGKYLRREGATNQPLTPDALRRLLLERGDTSWERGAPDGATEILVTQAYKFAFEKYQYGYAAAYATVIFGILLVYGTIQNRVTKATEA